MKKVLSEFIVNNRFIFVLICTAFIFSILALILPITYESCDDGCMLLFASGKYTGQPEPYLIFINVIFGRFVSWLYNLYSGLEWYSLLFAIVHVVSLSVIVWNILEKQFKTIYKVLFIILIFILEVRLVVHFQFTSTAAIGALAGMILIFKEKKYQRFFGIFLFFIASLIRFESAFMVGLVISPVLLQYLFKNRRIFISSSMIYLLSAMILAISFKLADSKFYPKTDEWKNYKVFNGLRGTINDNPNATKIIDNLPNGISETDYKFLLRFMPDANIVNSENMLLIKKQIGQVELKDKIKNVYPSLRKYTFILLLVFVFWLSIFLNKNTTKNKLILLLSFLVFIFVLCLLSVNNSLNYNVFNPILLTFFIAVIESFQNIDKLYLRIFSIAILISFVSLFSLRTYRIWNQRNDFSRNEFKEQNDLIEKFKKKKSIVVFAGDYSIEVFPAFSVSSQFPERIIFSHWVTKIPFDIGLYDSHEDFVNKNALFISKENLNEFQPLFIETIKKNYNKVVELNILEETRNYAIVEFNEIEKN